MKISLALLSILERRRVEMMIVSRIPTKFRDPLLFILALSMLAFLPGCSVGMAASGKEEPNLAACHTGATRLEVERELGAPKSSRVFEDGSSECVYEYELGNEPSPGRAVMHGGLDVLTLGLWEVVGTPVEATMGEKYKMTVEYGADGIATAVTTQRLKSDKDQ